MRLNRLKKSYRTAFLEGKRIVLRPLEEKDINARYLSWLNDKEVTKYIDAGTFPVTLKELGKSCDGVDRSKTEMILAIIDKKKDSHIGNIKLRRINWVHRYAGMGIMIGEKAYWGRGYAREACSLLLGYIFRKWNMNKILLEVVGTHKAAITVYKNVGFKIDGRIKGLLNIDGKYEDNVLMSVSRKAFESKNGRQ